MSFKLFFLQCFDAIFCIGMISFLLFNRQYLERSMSVEFEDVSLHARTPSFGTIRVTCDGLEDFEKILLWSETCV